MKIVNNTILYKLIILEKKCDHKDKHDDIKQENSEKIISNIGNICNGTNFMH